ALGLGQCRTQDADVVGQPLPDGRIPASIAVHGTLAGIEIESTTQKARERLAQHDLLFGQCKRIAHDFRLLVNADTRSCMSGPRPRVRYTSWARPAARGIPSVSMRSALL